MTLLRWSAALIVLVSGILIVSYMQRRFDEGDLRKGVEVIQGQFPEASDCRAEVISRFRGHVKVRCHRNGRTEEWLVDLVHQTIGGK